MKKKDLSGLQVGRGTIMRVMCEAGISVRTKDTRGGSVWVGAPGGISHRGGVGASLG